VDLKEDMPVLETRLFIAVKEAIPKGKVKKGFSSQSSCR